MWVLNNGNNRQDLCDLRLLLLSAIMITSRQYREMTCDFLRENLCGVHVCRQTRTSGNGRVGLLPSNTYEALGEILASVMKIRHCDSALMCGCWFPGPEHQC